MTSLDSVKTDGLVKAYTAALEEMEQHFPHPWGRSLVKLLQNPDLDRTTYNTLSEHFLNRINVWDEASLKVVAEHSVFFFHVRTELASNKNLLRIDRGEQKPLIDLISRILCKSEWIWSQMLQSDALDRNQGVREFAYYYAASFPALVMFADTTLTKSKDFVLKVLKKMPEAYGLPLNEGKWLKLVSDDLLYDSDVMLIVMSSRPMCWGEDMIHHYDSFHQNLKQQLDTFAIFRENFVPFVLRSDLNQGEERTLKLLQDISDYIGLPSKENIIAHIKADANYEAVQPRLRIVPGNAPPRKRDPMNTKDPVPLDQVLGETGNHVMDSPLQPLNRRGGERRQRKPVDRLTFH